MRGTPHITRGISGDTLERFAASYTLYSTPPHPFLLLQDYIPNLVALSKANLERDDPQLLASGNVLLKVWLLFSFCTLI